MLWSRSMSRSRFDPRPLPRYHVTVMCGMLVDAAEYWAGGGALDTARWCHMRIRRPSASLQLAECRRSRPQSVIFYDPVSDGLFSDPCRMANLVQRRLYKLCYFIPRTGVCEKKLRMLRCIAHTSTGQRALEPFRLGRTKLLLC